MPLEISSYVSIKGKITVPGDLDITLKILAFGMLSDCEITISNSSPSPQVDAFLSFLGRHGADIDKSADTITFRGGKFEGDVLIDENVPDAVFHCIICQALSTASSVRIVDGAGDRNHIFKFLPGLLSLLGITDDKILTDENDIMISGAEFSVPEIINVSSAWAFETVVSALSSYGGQIAISYPSTGVDHIYDVLTFLGFHITPADTEDNMDAELSRRLSRAEGKKSIETRTIEWPEKKGGDIKVPGDTTIAAAVCAAASLLERSNVTIENVFWAKGRRGFFEALNRMKARIEWVPDTKKRVFDSARVHVKWSKCEGIHLTSGQACSMIPELLVLGAVAAFASGKSVVGDPLGFPGHGRDVYSLLARGLETLGAHAGDFEEGIALDGMQELRGNTVDSAGKSDVALALVVAALKASGTTTITCSEHDEYPINEFLRIIKILAAEII